MLKFDWSYCCELSGDFSDMDYNNDVDVIDEEDDYLIIIMFIIIWELLHQGDHTFMNTVF